MKNFILLFVGLGYATVSFSQTGAEWTQQKKTQRKYLIKQIMAFQTYLGYLKKGYDIAYKGISNVQNIKNGEWNSHKEFFESLTIVNPEIRKYKKVADIVTMQFRIIKQAKSLINVSKNRQLLKRDEVDHIVRVCANLLSECLKNIDELILVTTSGELEMKDDERIKWIERIYSEMQDKSVFLQSFGNSVTLLCSQKFHEQLEIEMSKRITGINE